MEGPKRLSLEAKKIEYSNQVAYVLKCTVRRPVVFYLWRQRAKCRVAHLHTLPPANIAYLVSSHEQEAVIAADGNRQSGSNGGGDGDGNGDGDSGKEDDEGDGGGGDSNAIVTAAAATTKTTAATAPAGGTNNNQQNKEDVATKVTAAVRR